LQISGRSAQTATAIGTNTFVASPGNGESASANRLLAEAAYIANTSLQKKSSSKLIVINFPSMNSFQLMVI
jgi:hypothetical protein